MLKKGGGTILALVATTNNLIYCGSFNYSSAEILDSKQASEKYTIFKDYLRRE